jgi:RND family efflux transporter MFP subunit
LREAVARLSRAERDLERTRLLAPYDGRVRTERVDVGQFVKRGTAIGSLYAVDKVEVRLPIQDEELEFLDLPLAGGRAADAAPAPVVLRARFAGSIHEWQGEVVRTEGELDPGTRMVNVVAEVADPYAPRDGQPPLAVGLFVEAEILGRIVPNLAVLPRAALRGEGRVLVVDEGNRLRFRAVDVLRRANEQVFIRAGLAAGERVCVSPLPSTADGMRVRIIDQQPDVLAATPQGGEAS